VLFSLTGLAVFTASAGRTRVALAVTGFLVLGSALLLLVSRERGRRTQLALTVLLLLWIAVPSSRPIGSPTLLRVTVAAAALLTVLALRDAGGARLRGTTLVLVALLIELGAVTTLGADGGAQYKFVVALLAVLPPFLLAGAMDSTGRRALAAQVVALATGEAVLAVIEPLLFPQHLWVSAQRGSEGQVVPLPNELLSSLGERSQGTLGHPLPLGLVLLVGTALAVYVVRLHVLVRVGVVLLLLGGLVTAGARASLAASLVVVVARMTRRLGPLRAALLLGAAGAALSAPALADVAETGSFLHRLGAVQSVERLLSDQPLARTWFGSGYGAAPQAFEAGLLQSDKFPAVDNQFVLLLVQGGLAAVLLVGLLCLLVVVRAPGPWKPAVASVVVTFGLFDVLTWPSTAALAGALFGVCSAARARPPATSPTVPMRKMVTRAPR